MSVTADMINSYRRPGFIETTLSAGTNTVTMPGNALPVAFITTIIGTAAPGSDEVVYDTTNSSVSNGIVSVILFAESEVTVRLIPIYGVSAVTV